MDYDRIILELLSRISLLEEKVAILEGGTTQEKEAENKAIHAPGKKYRKLSDHLYDSGESRVNFTFKKIEEILGFNLPASAYEHRAFWANTTTHSIALSWLGVDYKVVEVDIEKETVIFEKKRDYEK